METNGKGPGWVEPLLVVLIAITLVLVILRSVGIDLNELIRESWLDFLRTIKPFLKI